MASADPILFRIRVKKMTDKATALIRQMAAQIPSLVAAAVVHLEDGLPIAEVSNRDDINAGAASAYLATIVQSNLQALKTLADGQITDNILITTDQYYFLIHHNYQRPYFLFVMSQKDGWIGQARLVMEKYNTLMERFLG